MIIRWAVRLLLIGIAIYVVYLTLSITGEPELTIGVALIILGLFVVSYILSGGLYDLFGSREDNSLPPKASAFDEPLSGTPDTSKVREYIINPPQGLPYEPFLMLTLIRTLVSKDTYLGVAVVCENEAITWRIYDFSGEIDEAVIAGLVRQSYPGANVTSRTYEESFTEPFERLIFTGQLTGSAYAPIQTLEECKNRDPLALFTQTLSSATIGERVSYLVLLGNAVTQKEFDDLWRDITVSRADMIGATLPSGQVYIVQKPSWGCLFAFTDLLMSIWGASTLKGRLRREEQRNPRLRLPIYEDKLQKVFQTKINSLPYHCKVLVQIDTPVGAAKSKYYPLLTILTEYSSDYQGMVIGGSIFDKEVSNAKTAQASSAVAFAAAQIALHYQPLQGGHRQLPFRRKKTSYQTSEPNPLDDCLLTYTEIAALWHMPTENFTSPIISWASAELPMPRHARNTENAFCLGHALYAGNQEKAYVPYASRTSHIYTIGRTRMGKSTFMHNLIDQDIANGYGVAVIDPHGELIQDILRYSIPDKRKDHVVLLEIDNSEHPIPLNVLTPPGNAPAHVVISALMALFIRYGDFSGTQTLIPAIEKALWLLSVEENPTLRNIERIFTDRAYTHSLLTKFHQLPPERYNPSVVAYWKAFYQRSEQQRTVTSAPLMQKLSDFYGTPELYRTVCHPDSLDFPTLIQNDNIILLSLADPKGIWTERQKHFIGGTLLSHIQLAAHSRGYHPKPFFLYIDEVQNFIALNLATVFSESGKFGLSLTVANQYLRQLTGDTLDAIKGNVGSMVMFRVGDDDAPTLAKSLRGVSSNDLLTIRPHNAIVSVPIQGDLYTFSIKGLPPPRTRTPLSDTQPIPAAKEQAVREASIKNYTPKTKDEVAQWLYSRYDQSLNIAAEDKQPTFAHPDDFLVADS